MVQNKIGNDGRSGKTFREISYQNANPRERPRPIFFRPLGSASFHLRHSDIPPFSLSLSLFSLAVFASIDLSFSQPRCDTRFRPLSDASPAVHSAFSFHFESSSSDFHVAASCPQARPERSSISSSFWEYAFEKRQTSILEKCTTFFYVISSPFFSVDKS